MADIPGNIIEGCRKGDQRCQEKLYQLIAPRIYGVCLQYAENTDDARDIMQEGFIRVYRNLEQFSGKGSFTGWVRKIMINTALERYRSQITLYSLDEKSVLADEYLYDDIVDNITADEMMNIIRSLSPKYRIVFNLHAIEGYNHKEIAKMLGITEGTSKSNLSRARAILQEKMKELFRISREAK